MKFTPCLDKCTKDGTHCQGCGRSHEEIAGTKKLVASFVEFIRAQDYENSDEFIAMVSKKVRKKLLQPPIAE